jgi:hypothetical protein
MILKIFLTFWKYIVLPLSILAFFTVIVYNILNPIKTIYNVTASTEKTKCIIKDIGNSSFNIYKAMIYDEKGKLIAKDFTGNFRYYSVANAEFERISNGPLIISIYNDTVSTVGGLYKEENPISITKIKNRIDIVMNGIDLIIQDGKSIIIPISGNIDIGNDVAGQVEGIMAPVLLNGTVTMTGYSNFTSNYFNAGEEKLYLGDRLIFESDTLEGIGFIKVSEEKAMNISYRVEAKQAKILKPGPRTAESGQKIGATIYDRLLNDKLFQIISLVAATSGLLATIGSFIMDYIKFKQ